MHTRKKLLIVLVGLAVATATAVFLRFGRPRQLTFDVSLLALRKPVPPLKLYADGQPIRDYSVAYEEDAGPYPVSSATISFQVMGPTYYWKVQETNPTLAAEMLHPCGWKPVKIKAVYTPPPEVIRKAAESGFHPSLVASIPLELNDLKVWVDNRGGKQMELSIGRLVTTIPAGASERFEFPMPDCHEGTSVKLDGSPVGDIPETVRSAAPNDYSVSQAFLVDTSGKRCYRYHFVDYGKPGLSSYDTGFNYYSRKRLHHLESTVEFFLRTAPKAVVPSQSLLETYSEDLPVSLGELVESPCR